jgi:hypothetical protein
MTEDPVKLYVIVMAILLCVLSYVAYDSYKQAHAYEAALERAPLEAKQMKVLATDVRGLVDQLSQSELKQGKKILIERVERAMHIPHSSLDNQTPPLGGGIKGREDRYIFEFGSGKSSPPQTRQTIAKFCEQVEIDSRGILKTIEIKLTRVSGEGMPEPGKDEKITGDTYRGTIVFGVRVVEQ